MTIVLRVALLVLVSVMSAACADDVYPKYLLMQQEAATLEKTCAGVLAKDSEFVYKGSRASITITCTKLSSPKQWINDLEIKLLDVNWLLRKRESNAITFCLKNEGIYLVVIPNAELQNRVVVMCYPNNLCAQ